MKNYCKLSPQFKCPTADALCAGGEEEKFAFSLINVLCFTAMGQNCFSIDELQYTCNGNN